MKKAILCFLSIFMVTFSFAQGLPEFTKGPAYVFDSQAIAGKANDALKVKNLSSAKNFGITVYGYKNDTWVNIATGFLKKLGDTDSLKCDYKVKKFRYFAVTTNSQYDFAFIIAKSHNDLNLIFTDEKDYSEKVDAAQVFDTKAISEKFKDNIKIRGGNGIEQGSVFYVYGSENADGPFTKITGLALKDDDDSDTSDTCYTGKELSNYRYIKIISSDEKDFNYSLSKNHNDLIISVN